MSEEISLNQIDIRSVFLGSLALRKCYPKLVEKKNYIKLYN